MSAYTVPVQILVCAGTSAYRYWCVQALVHTGTGVCRHICIQVLVWQAHMHTVFVHTV